MPPSQTVCALSADEVRVLLGVTGSVAAIKAKEVIDGIHRAACERGLKAHVQLLVTEKGRRFLPPSLHQEAKVDDDEWSSWKERGDAVLHIQVVQPICKRLMCGDTGMGAMAEPHTIASEAFDALALFPRRQHFDTAPYTQNAAALAASAARDARTSLARVALPSAAARSFAAAAPGNGLTKQQYSSVAAQAADAPVNPS
ncbi:hypothetical protein cyc_04180 [Cyclospora cayetanensis]|uniref:Flavoprotein domain-containing protein n=1 Tax=Cyclospora cayetanensis TaxID=88456 RepID=A0A1D3CRW7_9EIME|nr:hypothetical protein cyc_04180 [Cyclospora cayetanensis]